MELITVTKVTESVVDEVRTFVADEKGIRKAELLFKEYADHFLDQNLSHEERDDIIEDALMDGYIQGDDDVLPSDYSVSITHHRLEK